MVMLSDIVKKVQKDIKNLSNADKAMLRNSLEEHHAVQKTGYRVASKAQQQDVARMVKMIKQEVRDPHLVTPLNWHSQKPICM
jgi:rRNA maturation endonuclease Nob1